MLLVFSACCGCQHKGSIIETNEYETSVKFFNSYSADKENRTTRRVIYPIFGETFSTELYGMFFAPMYSLEEAIFMTVKVKPEQTVYALLSGIRDLFPLLLICLLMASVAGFCGWLLVSILFVSAIVLIRKNRKA